MLHDGHRERLRKKAEADALELHERLELFLFGVLPRVNTNETSHKLLERFGGASGLFCAGHAQLMDVDGVGRVAALSVRNLAGIVREYELELCRPSEVLKSDVEMYKLLSALFCGAYCECVYMLMFSEKEKFLGYKLLGTGSLSSVQILSRQAILYAKKRGAASVIIAHNHTDRICVPSDTDIESAYKMNVKFQNAGIRVREQYIVSDGRVLPFGDRISKWKE